MAECQHTLMDHAYGTVYRCRECGFEDEWTGEDISGMDTWKEARGEA